MSTSSSARAEMRFSHRALPGRHGDAEPHGAELAEGLGTASGEAPRQEARNRCLGTADRRRAAQDIQAAESEDADNIRAAIGTAGMALPPARWSAAKGESPANLALMRRIDELFLKYPFYGSRHLQAIYQPPRTSVPHPAHRIYPYLLKRLTIDRPNQVWCADITYIPVSRGFLYLVAIMDWATRHVRQIDKAAEETAIAYLAAVRQSILESPVKVREHIKTDDKGNVLMKEIHRERLPPDIRGRCGGLRAASPSSSAAAIRSSIRVRSRCKRRRPRSASS